MIENLTDEYITSEIEKLKYPYRLNSVIRYNLERKEPFQTQSLAEHVANMIFLAFYFRDFEDPNHELDFEKVIKLIMMHDMGEIETGDIIAPSKEESDYIAEIEAIKLVKEKSPSFIANEIESFYEESENPKTKEGKYARAIDKFDGQFFWMDKEKVEMVIEVHKKAGLETKIVYPTHMKQIFNMLDEYNFPAIKKFLEFIDKKKYSYGIL